METGIGETRAMLVRDGNALATKLHWPGRLSAGQVEDAQLIYREGGTPRGFARFSNGEEALVDHLPRHAAEGATIRLQIVRGAMAETGRMKYAHARPSDAPCQKAPDLAALLASSGYKMRKVHRFPIAGWEDIMSLAFAGEMAFAGGALWLSPTPAMTLIDVDGTLPPTTLALAAVEPLAEAIALLDLAGSIGVDFPTLATKAERKQVDQALGDALASLPHERTAMNGFGFIQIVSRLERPSLLHLATYQPAHAAARLLLRRAEQVDAPGVLLLTCHPRVRSCVLPEWEAELTRRTGRPVRWSLDSALAIEGCFAQALSS